MIEYLITYGRPRILQHLGDVIYERRQIRRKFEEDERAVSWACEVLPFELGLTHRGKRHLAVAIRCQRADRSGSGVVWEASGTTAARGCEPRGF